MTKSIKRAYTKPFMIVEAFVPQQFCVGCTMPGNYRIQGPWMESNGVQNCQATNNGDTYLNGWWAYFDSYNKDTQTINSYYKVEIKSPCKVIKSNTNNVIATYEGSPFPSNTILYTANLYAPYAVEKNYS